MDNGAPVKSQPMIVFERLPIAGNIVVGKTDRPRNSSLAAILASADANPAASCRIVLQLYSIASHLTSSGNPQVGNRQSHQRLAYSSSSPLEFSTDLRITMGTAWLIAFIVAQLENPTESAVALGR